jgi:hypothetical protein
VISGGKEEEEEEEEITKSSQINNQLGSIIVISVSFYLFLF